MENAPTGTSIYADIDGLRCNGGTIPVDLSQTPQKPDVVIVNRSGAAPRITLIELTIPWDTEEAVQAAEDRKIARYSDLILKLSDQSRAELITLEIGARGFISASNKTKITKICNIIKIKKIAAVNTTMSRLALIGSRTIWNGRNSKTWGMAHE